MRLLVLAATLLGATTASGAGSAEPTLDIISFSGSLDLLSGGRYTSLKPGAGAYSISPGEELTVVSGEATLMNGGASVKADKGDSLIFLLTNGQPGVLVRAGSVEVTSIQGETSAFKAGDLAILVPSGVMSPPTAGAGQPAGGPRGPEETGSAASGWDPLKALAKLDTLDKPSLNLQIELHPYYRLRQIYDSNIYLVPNAVPVVGGGVVGSMITQNNIGLKFEVPLNDKHKFGGSYDFRASNYAKQPKANNALDQGVNADYSYRPNHAVSLTLTDSYVNTEVPAFSELVVRERHWQNTAAAKLQIEHSRRLVTTLDFQDTVVKYLSPGLGGFLNRYELVFGGSIGIRPTPKTKIYTAYHRSIIHYTAGRAANSKGHGVDVGIDGDLAARLKGSVEGGYNVRRYERDIVGSARNSKTWRASAALLYKPGRSTDVRGTFTRSISESTFGANRFYVSTGGNLGVRQRLRKLVLGAEGTYARDQFSDSVTVGGLTAKRRDDLYRGDLTLDYDLRDWLAASFGFSRMARFSTFSRQFNYTVNRTSAELRVTF